MRKPSGAHANVPRMPFDGDGLAYKHVDDGCVEVYDLDFAAYCSMRDLPIADLEEESSFASRRTKYTFRFLDPNLAIKQYAIDYANSESARHADAVRRLKKAVRSSRGG